MDLTKEPSEGDAQPEEPVIPAPPAPTATGPSGPRAAFWDRFFGALCDGIILFIPNLFLQLELHGVGIGISFLIQIAYAIYFIGGPSGQTIGQKAMGLKTISMTDGQSIGYQRAALRWVVSIGSAICILIGYLWSIWDPEKQTWHDKAAESVVVKVSDYA